MIQTYGPSNTEPEKARSNTAFHPAVHSSTVYQSSSPSPQSRNERSWSWSSLLFSRAQLVSTSLSKERLVSPILLRFFRLWHSTFATGPLSACRAATNQATTPRLTRSPAFPHATADRGLFPHQTPIPSYQAVTTTLAVAATTTATAAKHCQLISGALLQAPEKEPGDPWRTDRSLVDRHTALDSPAPLPPPPLLLVMQCALHCEQS